MTRYCKRKYLSGRPGAVSTHRGPNLGTPADSHAPDTLQYTAKDQILYVLLSGGMGMRSRSERSGCVIGQQMGQQRNATSDLDSLVHLSLRYPASSSMGHSNLVKICSILDFFP
jgi:hypothetical protein